MKTNKNLGVENMESNITYKDIFKQFKERNPDIEKAIVDYRPAQELIGIEVFFENRRSMVFGYDVINKTFNFVE